MDVLDAVRQRADAALVAVSAAASRWLAPALNQDWAVVAVGGLGRREIFPHSDTDVLLLIENPESAASAKDAIHGFLRELWDGGWRPSHSVRTSRECCQFDVNNVELTLSLLTQRFVTGSASIHGQLVAQLPAFLQTQRRIVAAHLRKLTMERWAKFQHTIYHLEPDIKEAPGALRDLHGIEWMNLIQAGAAREPLGRLLAAREFLFRLRWQLHKRSGRNDNRLLFDAQDALFPRPESGMREYFRHARAIHREAVALTGSGGAGGIVQSFLDWRSRLPASEFTAIRERVLLRNPDAVAADPSMAVRLLQFVARHGFQLAPDAERRLQELAADPEWSFPAATRWRDLREILQLPHAARAVRALHETGLLLKLIPEWSRIECLVTRDFYHRYTVDEHTLVTLDSLDALGSSKDDAWALFRELLAEAGDGALLRLALLLHDLGKGSGDGRHEEHSAELAAVVMARLNLPDEDRDTVRFLIAHHLDLGGLMMGRDLSDPETLTAAAHQIGTIERLRLLTLLTFADISGVHPGALTSWRSSQLASAYRSLYREFTRELDAERIAGTDAPAAALDAFQQGFPTRYVLVHPSGERETHLLMSREAAVRGVAVRLLRQAEVWELTVVTHDRRRLFADLAGALAGYGMNILKAEAFGNRESTVVDIWRFHDPLRRLELNPHEAADLERLVARAVRGEENVARLLAARPRPMQAQAQRLVTPVVAFDPAASQRATLLEVVAADRPGLLYDLAAAIYEAGCDIEVVLVNTEAHRAIDVFYLTEAGSKLSASRQESLRQQLLSVLGVD